MIEIREKLIRHQKKTKITIEKLSADLGVGWFTVYRWLKKKTKPSALATTRIQKYLEILKGDSNGQGQ
jgi:transposase